MLLRVTPNYKVGRGSEGLVSATKTEVDEMFIYGGRGGVISQAQVQKNILSQMHPRLHATHINSPRTVTASEFSGERRPNLPLNIAHEPGCADSVLDRSVVFVCVRFSVPVRLGWVGEKKK